MKSAPFSYSIPMLVLMIVSLVLGAFLGALFGNSDISPILGAFLVGFLPTPVMSFLRLVMGGAMSHAAGVRGNAPFAWPFYIRYAICAVVAGVVAFVAISLLGQSLNFYSGMLIAAITSTIVALIMVIKVSMSGDD